MKLKQPERDLSLPNLHVPKGFRRIEPLSDQQKPVIFRSVYREMIKEKPFFQKINEKEKEIDKSAIGMILGLVGSMVIIYRMRDTVSESRSLGAVIFGLSLVILYAMYKSKKAEKDQEEIIGEEVQKLIDGKITNTQEQLYLVEVVGCRNPTKLAEILALNMNRGFLKQEAVKEIEKIISGERSAPKENGSTTDKKEMPPKPTYVRVLVEELPEMQEEELGGMRSSLSKRND